jgi:hypothetical protein
MIYQKNYTLGNKVPSKISVGSSSILENLEILASLSNTGPVLLGSHNVNETGNGLPLAAGWSISFRKIKDGELYAYSSSEQEIYIIANDLE